MGESPAASLLTTHSPLNETTYTQLALFALQYALAQLWKSWGIEPAVVMGYGVGEYVAACVAGVFTLEDGLKLFASQSHLLQPIEQFAPEVTFSLPQISIISSVTGQVTTAIATPEYWRDRPNQPIQFTTEMKTLYQQGCEVIITIGAPPSLAIGWDCTPEAVDGDARSPLEWLVSLRQGYSDWREMLLSLSKLYVRGVWVDWDGFDRDYPRQWVELPTYPFGRQRYWLETTQVEPETPSHHQKLHSAALNLPELSLSLNDKQERHALPVNVRARPEREAAIASTQDSLEQQLTQIWQEVLNIESIGIKDNFFDLGGYSQLAVELFAKIEQKFGKKLPLATLFEAATVEQVASILSQSEDSARWSSLVTIQPGGAKRPFFCVHALGGNVLSYKTLVNNLDPQQPVYALQAQGLDGKQVAHTTVEQMAAHYIREIRAVQPEGPYLLGGHSSGGTVAYEMAQQLIAQGQKVALLALFDRYTPNLFVSNPSQLRTIFVYLRTLLQLSPKDKLAYFLEKSKWLQSKLRSQRGLGLKLSYNYPLLDKLQPHEILLIETIKQATMVDYVPHLYPGRITLFRTKEELRWCRYHPQRGWEDLAAGGLEIYDVPGTHLGMLENAAAKNLAEKLQVCIEQAQQL